MSRSLLYAAIALGVAVLIGFVGGGRVAALDGDSVANLLYFAVLAVLIGAWTIRLPRQNALRNALLWLLIVLGLVAAYALRGDLSDAGRRIVSVLSPGTPIAGADSEGRPTVTLSKEASGHFVADATIAGTPVRFLLDTGATSTVLSPRDAARIGIDQSGLTYSIRVSTANGATTAARASVEDFALGPIRRARLPVMVARDLDQSLLGMDFLSSLDGYNVRGDTLTLTDR